MICLGIILLYGGVGLLDSVHLQLRAYDGDNEIKELSCTGEATPTSLNFVSAILGQGEPATGPIDGVRQSELMDALYESARNGHPVFPGKNKR